MLHIIIPVFENVANPLFSEIVSVIRQFNIQLIQLRLTSTIVKCAI